MDKNSIIGFILIAVVLIGFSWYSRPSEEEQRAAFVQDSIEQVSRAKAEKAAKVAAIKRQEEVKKSIAADTTALFHKALTGKAQNIVLQNARVALTFSTKGAVVTKAYLKNPKGSKRFIGHNISDKTGKSDDLNGITLFQGRDQSLDYTLVAKEMNINTADLYFTPSAVTDSTVTFTAEAGTGKTLALTYKLGKNYMLHMSLRATGMAGLFDPNANKLNVNWHELVKEQERGFTFENRYARLDWKNTEGGTDYLSEASDKQKTTEEAMDWVAY